MDRDLRGEMKTSCCPEYEDLVRLDVYGELEGPEAEAWRLHLESCPGCRAERARLVRIVEAAGEILRPGTRSDGEEAALTGRIMERLERDGQGTAPAWGSSRSLAWAAGGLALVLMVTGWLWMGPDHRLPPEQTVATLDLRAGGGSDDQEILRNLELLEDLETVEQVVRAIDRPEIHL